MSGGAVMYITRRCERDHESAHVGTDALVCPAERKLGRIFCGSLIHQGKSKAAGLCPARTDEGVCPYVR